MCLDINRPSHGRTYLIFELARVIIRRERREQFMPILIRDISRERREINALALGKIHYSEIEKHLVEERILEGLAYKEFMDSAAVRRLTPEYR